MKNFLLAISWLIFMAGCIGTDLVDDPVVERRIEIIPDRVALLAGSSTQVMARYFNEFGFEENSVVTWSILPANIADVDENGIVTAISPGQAILSADFQGVNSSARISVVLNENAAASVDISAPKTEIALGESVLVVATVKNINDQPITSTIIDWMSDNTDVAAVDANGLVTGVGFGMATIQAIGDGVFSNQIVIAVGSDRMGTFVPSGGYKAVGTATLREVNGDIILELSSNFSTSFALGTFIYLANNNKSGNTIRSSGIEISQITTNSAHTFNVSDKFPNVTLNQYKFVIILCKPASLVFGYAELN